MSKPTSLEHLFDLNMDVATKTIYIGDQYGSDGEDIGPKTASDAIKALLYLDKGKTAENTIKILLNSSGGSVFDGLAIYDAIRACKSFIHIHVIGQCASIATAILQAGDLRTASPNSWLMVHNGQAEDGKIDVRDVDSLKFITDRHKEQYYAILSEKSLLTPQEWEEKCKTDFWMSAKDAEDLQVIDRIQF